MNWGAGSCLIAGILCAQASMAEPLLNPGFETGVVSPWFRGIGTLEFPHDEFWSVTRTLANTGAWSATNVGNNELRQNFAPVATSSILEISLYLRKEGVTGNEAAAIQFHYLDGSSSQHIIVASELDLWEKHDLTGSPTPDQFLVGTSVFGVRSDVLTHTYVDDFVISVPEPREELLAAVALLVLALLATARLGTATPPAAER